MQSETIKIAVLDLKRKIGTEGLCLSAKVNLRGMSGRGMLMEVDHGPSQLRAYAVLCQNSISAPSPPVEVTCATGSGPEMLGGVGLRLQKGEAEG